MFKIAKNHRISHNIVQQIRRAILAGTLKPGDRLPSEKQLAENFGVSKASLREAIRSLEAIGLVEVRQGMAGGVFIQKVDLETARNNLFNYIYFQNPSIHEFSDLRTLIEPAMAEMAAEKATDDDLRFFEKNLENTRKQLASDTFFFDLDNQFHHRMASISNNRLICFVIDSVKNAIVKMKLELPLDRQFATHVYECHCRIFDAIVRKDAAVARDEMARHIHDVEKELITYCDADSPFSQKNRGKDID